MDRDSDPRENELTHAAPPKSGPASLKHNLLELLHVVTSFPLSLPQSVHLHARSQRGNRRLLIMAVIFWILILISAGLLLGVWSLGYKGAHLISREPRGVFNPQAIFVDGGVISPSTLPYCAQSNLTANTLTCSLGSASQIVIPSPDAIFVVTRQTEQPEYRICGYQDDTCTLPVWGPLGPANDFYWAGIEQLRVRVLHGIVIGNTQYTSVDLDGELLDTNGDVIQEFRHQKNDIQLGTILQAAGVNLDTPHDGSTVNNSYRFEGLLLNIVVEYSNWHHFSRLKHLPSFEYRVYKVPETDYRTVLPDQGNVYEYID